ncbi:DNA-binding transcriptional LysR family regulator [Zymomonas mobilis]|uniref:DNA-binding transcriptional LysR family regulator n=1 Tax=Zymomonas mobilis TaxID=542 RepID=A0A542W3J0_ZYMMB|nr:LysR substrate-binding domain-containing protein [Zymomonas mobilis]TQL18079.1 DNA-binding transcriptional LysR family regulator [Zymomonas mobilis]
MDIRQLRHFLAVAENLHFGKAAEQIGITQPPLSQSIMALEKELGTPLFLRSKRHVSLTSFGLEWLNYVKTALEGVDALPQIAERLREGTKGHLDLSFVSTADFNILPILVRRYRSLYPDVELSLSEATSDIQISDLTKGLRHAGIIIPPRSSELPAGLCYKKLVSEPLIAAVPALWIKEQRFSLINRKLSPDSVRDAPLIIFPRHFAPAFYDLVIDYYQACGAYPNIAQQAIQMQTIISLVAAGMGIALVPRSLRHMARRDVRYIELQKPAAFLETGIAWRKDDYTPTLTRFLEVTREMLAVIS